MYKLQRVNEKELTVSSLGFSLTLKQLTYTKKDVEEYFEKKESSLVLYTNDTDWVCISQDGYMVVRTAYLNCIFVIDNMSELSSILV